MRIAWDEPEEAGLPAGICRSALQKMEGKTEKLKNPATKGSLNMPPRK